MSFAKEEALTSNKKLSIIEVIGSLLIMFFSLGLMELA
jgi:hypothetical protein